MGNQIWKTLSSVRTGIVLLILVGLAAAAGTMVLQRPITDPAQLERAYSPAALAWLDRLGLTDVFHSWWFVALLGLLCANIVAASVERFPAAWAYFRRPYRRPEPHFRAALPLGREIPVRNAEAALAAAERGFRKLGLKPERVAPQNGNGAASLFAEKHRAARLAAYLVHASLLLIFAGGITDALWGWRGFVALTENYQTGEVELRDGSTRTLPFTLRCDSAGQENYPDGTPQRWWTQLVVLEEGREVLRKQVEVNDPLTHRGLRFFQSSYGSTGEARAVHLTATAKQAPGSAAGPSGAAGARHIVLRPGEPVALDAETTVRLAGFVPDFVIVGNRVESRSDQPNNPAILLMVARRPGDENKPVESKVWLFPRFPDFAHPDASPYAFQFDNLEMGYFTGLQVAYEPGQWAVWAGALLMGLGLVMAFYMTHTRWWAVPLDDGRGRRTLWLGASAGKNRAELEHRFRRLVEEMEQQLAPQPAAPRTSAAQGVVHAAH